MSKSLIVQFGGLVLGLILLFVFYSDPMADSPGKGTIAVALVAGVVLANALQIIVTKLMGKKPAKNEDKPS